MKSVRVWLEDDIQNTLDAAALSSEMIVDEREASGFRKALAILAKAFGVHLPAPDGSAESSAVKVIEARR